MAGDPAVEAAAGNGQLRKQHDGGDALHTTMLTSLPFT
jgi:hypothetical protein